MSDLAASITGFVAGDDLEVRRGVTEVPSALDKAWLTIKRHDNEADAQAILQKVITTADVPGTGQIEDDGGGDGEATVRFDFTDADTLLLGGASFVYDIKVKCSTGDKLYRIEVGTIQLTRGVTDATS